MPVFLVRAVGHCPTLSKGPEAPGSYRVPSPDHALLMSRSLPPFASVPLGSGAGRAHRKLSGVRSPRPPPRGA